MNNNIYKYLIKDQPEHRHSLLAKWIPKQTKTILDVGGSSYALHNKKWFKTLGAPGKLWKVTFFSDDVIKKRRILTLNVKRDYDHSRRPDIYYDGLHIPFKNNSFDTITSVDVFEHMPLKDRVIVLKEMLRVAKLKVLITFPFNSEENKKLEEDILILMKQCGLEPKPSFSEHKLYGLPSVDQMKFHLNNWGILYNIYYGTNQQLFKHFFFYKISIYCYLKSKVFKNEKNIISNLKKLEKIHYKLLSLDQEVSQNRAYRTIIVVDATNKPIK